MDLNHAIQEAFDKSLDFDKICETCHIKKSVINDIVNGKNPSDATANGIIRCIERMLKEQEDRSNRPIEIITELRDNFAMNYSSVAKELGVSSYAVSLWHKGKTHPSTENLAKLEKLIASKKEAMKPDLVISDRPLATDGKNLKTDTIETIEMFRPYIEAFFRSNYIDPNSFESSDQYQKYANFEQLPSPKWFKEFAESHHIDLDIELGLCDILQVRPRVFLSHNYPGNSVRNKMLKIADGHSRQITDKYGPIIMEPTMVSILKFAYFFRKSIMGLLDVNVTGHEKIDSFCEYVKKTCKHGEIKDCGFFIQSDELSNVLQKALDDRFGEEYKIYPNRMVTKINPEIDPEIQDDAISMDELEQMCAAPVKTMQGVIDDALQTTFEEFGSFIDSAIADIDGFSYELNKKYHVLSKDMNKICECEIVSVIRGIALIKADDAIFAQDDEVDALVSNDNIKAFIIE